LSCAVLDLPAWMQADLGTRNLCRTGREAMPMTPAKAAALRLTTAPRKSCFSSSQNRISYDRRPNEGVRVWRASCTLRGIHALLKPFCNKAFNPACVNITKYYLHNPFTVLSSQKIKPIISLGHSLSSFALFNLSS